jgi:hypothetical protein
MNKEHLTAGEKSLKAASDSTIYDSLDVGHALTDDIADQLRECALKHSAIFDEDEFCLVIQLANDPLLKNLKRRKFYAWPYLPTPRPNQTVFHYNKKTDNCFRLWVLPEVETMIVLYEKINVAECWRTMKYWSQAFFNGNFWHAIRHQHSIDMLSELEYLDANREKLIKAGCKYLPSVPADPFDFSKVMANKIVHTNKVVLN